MARLPCIIIMLSDKDTGKLITSAPDGHFTAEKDDAQASPKPGHFYLSPTYNNNEKEYHQHTE